MNSCVFDTNVIVTAHLSPFGVPARLLAEYREVLGRRKFDFSPLAVRAFMQILEDQDLVIPILLTMTLPDSDDLMFLKVEAAAGNLILVTGNTKHYPQKCRGSLLVVTPAEALSMHLK